MNSFCLYHIQQFFLQYDPLKDRVDTTLHKYFKNHRALGSKDRRAISEWIYKYIRNRMLISYVLNISTIQDVSQIQQIEKFDFESLTQDCSIPKNILYGLKESFYNFLEKSLSNENFETFLKSLHQIAPIFGRSNPLKITRDDLIEQLNKKIPLEKTVHSPYGIIFKKRENFSQFEEFKKGLFEIQDESSQLAAIKLQANPKENVLDYCAGGGGKSLLIGAMMKNQGQLFLHDIRPFALDEAKKRLKRAGVQNYQILPCNFSRKKYEGYFDKVLLDVPCSGTGTLRRNPDMTSRLTPEMIENLVVTQRKIFDETIHLVKKGGHILYATCSIIPEENENQIDYFVKNYPVATEGESLKILPQEGSSDGFFARILKKL